MSAILAALSSKAAVQSPTPKKEMAPPQPPSKPAPKPAEQPEKAAPTTGNGGWHDPLAVCTLRTAKLANKTGAKFGWVRNGGTKAHQGIDLIAVPGTPIYAVADGVVYSTKAPTPGYAYGNTLVLEVALKDLPQAQADYFRKINPGNDTIGFFYAHLSELPAKSPMIVHAGQVIGKSGQSGNAKGMSTEPKGAHLHFEARQKAKMVCAGLTNRVDPLPFIQNCTNR